MIKLVEFLDTPTNQKLLKLISKEELDKIINFNKPVPIKDIKNEK